MDRISYVVIIYHGPDSDNGEIAAVQKDLPFFYKGKASRTVPAAGNASTAENPDALAALLTP